MTTTVETITWTRCMDNATTIGNEHLGTCGKWESNESKYGHSGIMANRKCSASSFTDILIKVEIFCTAGNC